MTEAEYSDRALEQLEDLETETAKRIVDKIDEATEWTEHHLKRLSNSEYYTLRAGDYRAIIDWERNEGEENLLFVIAVAHRDVVYDRYL